MTTHSEPKGQEGGCAALGGLLSCRPSQTIRLLGFVSRRTTKAHDMRQLHCLAVRTFVPTKKVLKVLYTEAESPRSALEPVCFIDGRTSRNRWWLAAKPLASCLTCIVQRRNRGTHSTSYKTEQIPSVRQSDNPEIEGVGKATTTATRALRQRAWGSY